MCSNLSFKLLVSKLFPQFSLRALKKVIHEEEYKTLFHCVTQFCRVSSLYFFFFFFFLLFYKFIHDFSLPPAFGAFTHPPIIPHNREQKTKTSFRNLLQYSDGNTLSLLFLFALLTVISFSLFVFLLSLHFSVVFLCFYFVVFVSLFLFASLAISLFLICIFFFLSS